ncbi:uncharacterized mitochondrial protein AtMg00860-like [Aristolochia californica]|uniref:uncharacterized mitochondrial protein AtMg00860-like n=1 Tax=Aristolochia californica TaxID=171875 RepID=UPI0035DA2A9C
MELRDAFNQFTLRMGEYMAWDIALPSSSNRHSNHHPPSPPPPMAPLRPVHPIPVRPHDNNHFTVPSKNWEDHIQHLHQVFDLMRSHHLFFNQSKCSLGTSEVAYLGHVISASGVKVDSSKIQAVVDWPTPHSVTALRGFLGLAGYYRKFIRVYGQIMAPLNRLLTRNTFKWSNLSASSFEQLKHALASAPVLQLPNFEEPFVIECDAS